MMPVPYFEGFEAIMAMAMVFLMSGNPCLQGDSSNSIMVPNREQKEALIMGILKIPMVPFDYFRDDIPDPARFAVLYDDNGFVVYIKQNRQIFLFRKDTEGHGRLRRFFENDAPGDVAGATWYRGGSFRDSEKLV